MVNGVVMKTKRKYDEHFKRDVIDLPTSSNKSLSRVAAIRESYRG
jgi:hypothetical protein